MAGCLTSMYAKDRCVALAKASFAFQEGRALHWQEAQSIKRCLLLAPFQSKMLATLKRSASQCF